MPGAFTRSYPATHLPSRHTVPAPQRRPQPPQLLESKKSETHLSLQHVWLMPGSAFVPQQVSPQTLSLRQHIPPPPPAGTMNLPPRDLYPRGQQAKNVPEKLTCRSCGQHVYLRRFAAGTEPDPSACCAHTSPLSQQTTLPGDSSQAFVPFGQHFAWPP